jgi:hypothetical protein
MNTRKAKSDKKKDKTGVNPSVEYTQIGDFFSVEGLAVNAILFLIFLNILIRFSVGLESYSGNY